MKSRNQYIVDTGVKVVTRVTAVTGVPTVNGETYTIYSTRKYKLNTL